ncbi:MAG: ATP-dependent helicase HrpB, partial [Muribaculaceae bacterium]|nr:ATP-dependent helicase HrpB [Muribaculaceae bacterium]
MKIRERFKHLPISDIADEVNISLAMHSRLIVTAPPGAGKSTLLPLSLLESIPDGKILMLEPRRIAARQVAGRMASMLGEKIGDSVGYRVRFDSRVSAKTCIEVITEGILERILV